MWNTTSKNITVSVEVIHDVAVTSVTPSPTEVTIGKNVTITVVVKNNGSVAETFDVTVYYDTTKIGTQTVTDLASEAEKTLTFTWNTTGVAAGNYTIKAVAEILPTGETNTANNELIDGQVEVKEAPVGPVIPWMWIGIGAVVVVVIIAAYMLMRKSQK